MNFTLNMLVKCSAVAAVLLARLPLTFAQATLPSDFSPSLPDIPDRTFKITDYGAIGDGKTLNTSAFTKTVAACDKAGGGIVNVPPGKFLTGPFTLASNLNLHLEAGSTILLSDDPRKFAVNKGVFQSGIMLSNGHDVAITGSGSIDGQGGVWWRNFVPAKNADPSIFAWMPRRPRLIVLNRCSRILVEGVTLMNSPSFHLVPSQCQSVTIQNIRITSPVPSPNTDGIDPSGINFRIKNCTIDTGDDCIAVKAGNRYDPKRPAVENFLITDSTFLRGHGMSVGSEASGGLRNMLVRNCSFDGTEAGIRLKSPRGRGGLVEYVTYEHLTMKNVGTSVLISSYYPWIPLRPDRDDPQPVVDGETPTWRHIRITDVVSTHGDVAGIIAGLPEMDIEDVLFTRVRISARKNFNIANAKSIEFVDCDFSGTPGKPTVHNADVKGLNQLQ